MLKKDAVNSLFIKKQKNKKKCLILLLLYIVIKYRDLYTALKYMLHYKLKYNRAPVISIRYTFFFT